MGCGAGRHANNVVSRTKLRSLKTFPTSEQAEELREWLFGGDWQEPAPDWYAGLSEDERIAAIIAAEQHGTPWHYSPEDVKRRTEALRRMISGD